MTPQELLPHRLGSFLHCPMSDALWERLPLQLAGPPATELMTRQELEQVKLAYHTTAPTKVSRSCSPTVTTRPLADAAAQCVVNHEARLMANSSPMPQASTAMHASHLVVEALVPESHARVDSRRCKQMMASR